jgi:hypothetical protein
MDLLNTFGPAVSSALRHLDQQANYGNNTVHSVVHCLITASSRLLAGVARFITKRHQQQPLKLVRHQRTSVLHHVKYLLLLCVSIRFKILFNSVFLWMNRMRNEVSLESVGKNSCHKFHRNPVPSTKASIHFLESQVHWVNIGQGTC